jgi:hypothetical protein
VLGIGNLFKNTQSGFSDRQSQSNSFLVITQSRSLFFPFSQIRTNKMMKHKNPTFPRSLNWVRWIVYALIFLTEVEQESLVSAVSNLPPAIMLMNPAVFFFLQEDRYPLPSLFRLSE